MIILRCILGWTKLSFTGEAKINETLVVTSSVSLKYKISKYKNTLSLQDAKDSIGRYTTRNKYENEWVTVSIDYILKINQEWWFKK